MRQMKLNCTSFVLFPNHFNILSCKLPVSLKAPNFPGKWGAIPHPLACNVLSFFPTSSGYLLLILTILGQVSLVWEVRLNLS